MGGLASPSNPVSYTQPVKNRPFSAYTPILQDFLPLETLILHPSALELSVIITKLLKTVEDVSISQSKEQKARIKAINKDSMQQNPKILRNIFKAIQLKAIFEFTKFFYFENGKETQLQAFFFLNLINLKTINPHPEGFAGFGHASQKVFPN